MISGGIEVINSHENHTSDWFYRQLIERSVFETAVLLQYQQPIKRTLPLKPLRKKKNNNNFNYHFIEVTASCFVVKELSKANN